MLQACLNGGLLKSVHHGVPTSASELAYDAVAVRAAGAEELHIHVRAEDGAETLEPSVLGSCREAGGDIVTFATGRRNRAFDAGYE